ncbi:Clp protease N-terminal domain-containing protein [Amycolatopsis sp. FDAARGOS 1241]|uniref:Clp protease N-terminal domain-containing protein n=1 Tax=Amycolatopsis sp. FDAARGOS 1241 TaxID=2778070 RepID=UPI001EF16CD4|nr:Clp protease N-terminal domain-containing protein [Amycolatopsis sp. FDAARGOS 1241]
MTGFFPRGPGDSPFDQFLAQFFGQTAPGRRPSSVDVTQLLSDPARKLVAEAAGLALDTGHPHVDTEHLLWAATRSASTAQLLQRAGVDVRRLSQVLERSRREAGSAGTAPARLAPAAKWTLLDAHRIARGLGSSFIGPEHLLLALAANGESAAGRLLSEQGVTPERLRSAGTERVGDRPAAIDTPLSTATARTSHCARAKAASTP